MDLQDMIEEIELGHRRGCITQRGPATIRMMRDSIVDALFTSEGEQYAGCFTDITKTIWDQCLVCHCCGYRTEVEYDIHPFYKGSKHGAVYWKDEEDGGVSSWTCFRDGIVWCNRETKDALAPNMVVRWSTTLGSVLRYPDESYSDSDAPSEGEENVE